MKQARWIQVIDRMRERMNEPIFWWPFPALIGFGLVIILRGHLLSGLNHRLGSRADVIQMKSEMQPATGIWLSIHQEMDRIVVVTDDRRRFTWPLKSASLKDLDPLVTYLREKVRREAYASAMAMETVQGRTKAILAVDQKLKYIHIRPLVYALAQARIPSYGFETKMVR